LWNRSVFDQWYFTPGWFAGGVPTVYNKHAYVTGSRPPRDSTDEVRRTM